MFEYEIQQGEIYRIRSKNEILLIISIDDISVKFISLDEDLNIKDKIKYMNYRYLKQLIDSGEAARLGKMGDKKLAKILLVI